MKILVLQLAKYTHTVINVTDIVRNWNTLSSIKRNNIRKIPKENRDEPPCHCREQEHKDATHRVPPMGPDLHC